MTTKPTNSQFILKNPLNKSLSKQQYTFSKANRFQYHDSKVQHIFYDCPSTKNQRTTSLGIGKRKVFDSQNKNPPPNQYDLGSSLSSKGFALITGRQLRYCNVEDSKSKSLLQKNMNPGPGTYLNPEFIEEGSKYSMRRKIKQKLEESSKYPGPGNYDIKSELLNENKVLSSQKRFICPTIKIQNRSKRLKTEEEREPPIYCPKITYKGKKIWETEKTFSLGKSERFPQRMKTEGPGPGSYKQFSQFAN